MNHAEQRALSHAICFMQAKKLGHGDFSHAGLAITREVLDMRFLEPGKVYVWESTLSAPSGFWARFTDKVPDAETAGLRFGVQIRNLELVVPGYSSNGGKVAWCASPQPSTPARAGRAGTPRVRCGASCRPCRSAARGPCNRISREPTKARSASRSRRGPSGSPGFAA